MRQTSSEGGGVHLFNAEDDGGKSFSCVSPPKAPRWNMKYSSHVYLDVKLQKISLYDQKTEIICFLCAQDSFAFLLIFQQLTCRELFFSLSGSTGETFLLTSASCFPHLRAASLVGVTYSCRPSRSRVTSDGSVPLWSNCKFFTGSVLIRDKEIEVSAVIHSPQEMSHTSCTTVTSVDEGGELGHERGHFTLKRVSEPGP